MSAYPTTTVSQDPLIIMFTAPNAGPKTLQGTHSYLIGRRSAYLIDPGPRLPDYQEYVLRHADGEGVSLHGVLLTHGHPDHAPGAAIVHSLTGVSVWGSPFMQPDDAAAARRTHTLGSEKVFHIDEHKLFTLASPGHSADHVAFWAPQSGVLFSGDVILGEGSTLVAPPEGNMVLYMETLQRFASLNARIIAPGHGSLVIDPAAKIDEYVRHRQQRESQVIQELGQGPATIPELVERIYAELDESLHELAQGSVAAQLQKLVHEGRVIHANTSYRLSEPTSI